jgi:hypothetical protein
VKIYTLKRVNEEEARTVAETVAERFKISRVRVRGLAEAVRASGNEAVVPDGATGYFEDETDPDGVGPVTESLSSLTRVVFYSDTPVFAWFEDGKVRLRGDEQVLRDLRDRGIEPSAAAETPESVLTEMVDDE